MTVNVIYDERCDEGEGNVLAEEILLQVPPQAIAITM